MRDLIRHVIVGNDTHPAIVAAARAFIGAFIFGALGFLAMWANTDEVKVLVIAGLTPFLTNLALRLGLEGVLDTWKNGKQ